MNMTAWFPYADNSTPGILEYIKNGPDPAGFSLVAYCKQKYQEGEEYLAIYQLEAA